MCLFVNLSINGTFTQLITRDPGLNIIISNVNLFFPVQIIGIFICSTRLSLLTAALHFIIVYKMFADFVNISGKLVR